MKLEINSHHIEQLHHSRCASFVNEQPDRFESTTYEGAAFEECHENGTLYFVGDNYLNALILYQWFKNVQCVKAAILFDTAYNNANPASWLVWVDKTPEWDTDEDQVAPDWLGDDAT
tara:strand:+ start:121 stop:471 length:351 start_codon:yes stop_codon:yes gene_type:complete